MSTNNSNKEPTFITVAERLLDDLLALPDDTDDCVKPYEAVQYAADELNVDGRRHVEQHCADCESCANFLDGILSGVRQFEKERRLLPWLTAQLGQLGAALSEQASHRTRSTAFGRNVARRTIRLPLALPEQFKPVFDAQVFDTAAPFEASTPDQRLRWRIVDEGAEVAVMFDSEIDDLVDMPFIRLHFGDAVEPVVFTKCAGRIVGTAIFSKVQLGSWSLTDVLQLEVEGLDDDFSG